MNIYVSTENFLITKQKIQSESLLHGFLKVVQPKKIPLESQVFPKGC